MSELSWTEGQRAALAAFESFLDGPGGGVYLLRGPAGTGKTEVLRAFVERASARDPGRFAGADAAVWAPTGQAAQRLGQRLGVATSTVHAALYSDPSSLDNGDDHPPTLAFVLRTGTRSGGLFIIDEASLVGNTPPESTGQPLELKFGAGHLLDDVLHYTLAAGGRLVMAGDPYQLPAWGEDRAWALEEETFIRRGLHVVACELDEVVRQAKGSAIAGLGEEIRARAQAEESRLPTPRVDGAEISVLPNPVPEPVLDALATGDAVALAWRNADVNWWNRRVRRHRGFPAGALTVGDRLVLVRTAHAVQLMNGDELVVTRVGDLDVVRLGDRTVRLRACDIEPIHDDQHPGAPVLVVEDLLEAAPQSEQARVTATLWGDFVRRMRDAGISRQSEEFTERMRTDGRWNSLRATYSYARTVYRAQGGEWPTVVFDVGGAASLGRRALPLAYTAVTRARSELHLRGWPTAIRPFDVGLMCDQLLEVCSAAVGGGMEAAPMPGVEGAVQLKAADGTRLTVGVYTRGRVPTKHVMGGHPEHPWRQSLDSAIGEWVRSTARSSRPPDERVVEYLTPLVERLALGGVDTELWEQSQYVVGVGLRRGEFSTELHYNHRADGSVTRRRSPDVISDDLALEFEELLAKGTVDVGN